MQRASAGTANERAAARPMKVVVADDGTTWLCDAEVDETRDLEEQGCWRCARGSVTRRRDQRTLERAAGILRDQGAPGAERSQAMDATTLSSHDVFRFLQPRQMDVVSNTAEEITLKAGETVFRKGERAAYLYAVLDGQVTLRVPRKDGVSLKIEDLRKGSLFGSCMCFELDEYSLNAVCTEDSRLLKVDAETLKGVMDEDLSVGYPLQRMISKTYFKRYLDTMKKLQTVAEALALST
jgi:CRP-like cAMP-binding protein